MLYLGTYNFIIYNIFTVIIEQYNLSLQLTGTEISETMDLLFK